MKKWLFFVGVALVGYFVFQQFKNKSKIPIKAEKDPSIIKPVEKRIDAGGSVTGQETA